MVYLKTLNNMEEWREYKISDICNIKHGYAFKGEYFTDEYQRFTKVDLEYFNESYTLP